MMVDEQTEPTSDKPQADQRRNLRAPLLTLKIKLGEGRKYFFGYAKNLSRSGLFVATLKPLSPGEQVLVEFPLPEPLSEVIQCRCEVVWTRAYQRHSPYDPGMGLKFIDPDPDIARLIDAWVKNRR